jgi:hypothetical protein
MGSQVRKAQRSGLDVHLALRLAKQLRDELRVVLRELTALLEARPTGQSCLDLGMGEA